MSDSEKKKQLKETFNSVASGYDANQFFSISAKKMLSLLELDKAEKMIDIATGTGIIANEAAIQSPNLKIDAIDFSEKMLNQASQKAKQNNIQNINFVKIDIEAFDFPKSHFDIATCGYGLFFLADPISTVKKIAESLKPKGKFIFSSFTEEAFVPCNDLFLKRIQEYDITPPELSWRRFKTKDQIHYLCKECGLNNIEIHHHEIRYDISIDQWWELLNNAGYKGLLDQIDPARLSDYKKEHLKDIQNISDNGTIILNTDSFYTIIQR